MNYNIFLYFYKINGNLVPRWIELGNLQNPLLSEEKKTPVRVRNLKFATYLKFATCENTNKINELWWDLLTV